MDNLILKNNARRKACGFLLLFILVPFFALAQQGEKSYDLLPAPDLWYNDVDGIRVGLRVKGQVPGSFDDGPHRLDLGVWLGTWFPDNPVSYYLSFTEPIPSISDFGSEGNVQLFSSIRTGFHQHGIAFNKRWQNGFNEQNYKEFSLSFRIEDRFESEYLQYSQLWNYDWLYLLGLDFRLQDENSIGNYSFSTMNSLNIAGPASSFINSSLELLQLVPLNENFELRGRLYGGISSNNAPVHYLYTHSFKSTIGWMDNGLTRAKGTIPTTWMNDGIFQISGGPNLRGYLKQDFDLLNQGMLPVFTSMGAINFEFDYPNPLDKAIKNIPVLGGILSLRSYLFFDSGTSFGVTEMEEPRVLSDAGLGFMFSLNIPDYLGKPRGIKIRYDVPLWLSNPREENNFDYRSVIGIGAVIPL